MRKNSLKEDGKRKDMQEEEENVRTCGKGTEKERTGREACSTEMDKTGCSIG
jgi:hypothetical protein